MTVHLPDDIKLLERGWLSSNNVLFLSGSNATVVDTGYASHAPQTVDLLNTALSGRTLSRIINTHLHSDHCGGNAALQAYWPQLETHIPPGLTQAVQNWNTVALSYDPTGQTCPPFHFTALLEPGQTVMAGMRELQVHAAPGHDPHAVLLFDPDLRLLLSADALWENGFGVVFPELEGESAFHEVKDTLDLIESLQAEMVIPGHGPLFTDVKGALLRARKRLDKYEQDPVFHARYAGKVLLKFRLLETQGESLESLHLWTQNTAYFKLLHNRYFKDTQEHTWFLDLINDLAKAQALKIDGDQVINL